MLNRLGSGKPMTSKPCIACAEDIKVEALLCKYCKTLQDNSDFVSTESAEFIPVQIALNNASLKLRQAHYCFRDDLVFDRKYSGDPETYIERLIDAEQ